MQLQRARPSVLIDGRVAFVHHIVDLTGTHKTGSRVSLTEILTSGSPFLFGLWLARDSLRCLPMLEIRTID
jgi:hypothetical protein